MSELKFYNCLVLLALKVLGFDIVSLSKQTLAWVYKDFVAIYNGQTSDGNVGIIKQVS